jgi:tRNA 2-thiouridine synthesizing protein A
MGDDTLAPDREVAGAEPAPAGPVELDLHGEVCPYTFLKARLALETLPAGAILRVLIDNEASARDVPRSLAGAGHAVLGCTLVGDQAWVIVVRRGTP